MSEHLPRAQGLFLWAGCGIGFYASEVVAVDGDVAGFTPCARCLDSGGAPALVAPFAGDIVES